MNAAGQPYTTTTTYRFGYQGQFAEKDDETGYNQFEARLYDTRINRWLTTDPAAQYWSPYLGMGNNWPNGVDPDGEWVKGAGFFNNLFHSDEVATRRYAMKELSHVQGHAIKYGYNMTESGEMLIFNMKGQPVTADQIKLSDRMYWVASDFNIVALPNLTKQFTLFSKIQFRKRLSMALDNADSFKGASPESVKKFLIQEGWEILPAKKGKPGFRAVNPNNNSDVIHIIQGNSGKLKDGTNIINIKQGDYMKRPVLGWDRIPLEGNPNL